MNASICLKTYINSENYAGGLIGISDLSMFCGIREGQLYTDLVGLRKAGNIDIIKRYSCPEFHNIDSNEICENRFYCHECDINYSAADLILEIYINPLSFRDEIIS